MHLSLGAGVRMGLNQEALALTAVVVTCLLFLRTLGRKLFHQHLRVPLAHWLLKNGRVSLAQQLYHAKPPNVGRRLRRPHHPPSTTTTATSSSPQPGAAQGPTRAPGSRRGGQGLLLLVFCGRHALTHWLTLSTLLLLGLSSSGCSTLPDTKHETYLFPKTQAFWGDVSGRPYHKLGLVRAKVDFVTLDPASDERTLCRNYFNKAVRDLVKLGAKQGGDAVIDLKSAVFFEDGQMSLLASPECSDDGMTGQVNVQGVAIRWDKQQQPAP